MALRALFLTCVFISGCKSQFTQDFNEEYPSQQQYYGVTGADSREGRLPNPGDPDYRTYVYNSRRYGPKPNRYNPYNPDINKPGGFPYHPLNPPYNPLNPNPLDEDFKFNTVSKNNN